MGSGNLVPSGKHAYSLHKLRSHANDVCMAREFDPNQASTSDSGVFGLPFSEDEAKLVIFGVPWDVTTSYRPGTNGGPEAVFEASKQVDLFDIDVEKPYEPGIFMRPVSQEIAALNRQARRIAEPILEAGGCDETDPVLGKTLKQVNAESQRLNDWVKKQTQELFAAGKIPALLGGDHATPLGCFQAVGERYPGFGILHIDAHSDTRIAFEGFQYSHASIMHNALTEVPELKKLVQVGIRDFCQQEWEFCESQKDRVTIYFDAHLTKRQYSGATWLQLTKEMIDHLPPDVWISFDIDGLDPKLCPATGTPVPGGLEFAQATALFEEIVRSGRKIIGFDLNEVGAEEWDANVGARMLYKMCAWTFASHGMRTLRS